MKFSDAYCVSEFAEFLSVAESSVYRWIRNGKLNSKKRNGVYAIPFDQNNTSFIVQKIQEKYSNPQPYVPENIQEYDKWHTLLDEICWLIKITYSSRENTKKKRFRLDNILQNYIHIHNISLSNLRNVYSSKTKPSIKAVSDDLRRAWYNELSYSFPLKTSTNSISFSDITINKDLTIDRFAFPSWRIIKFYYSIYFYVRTMAQIKNPLFNISRHNSTLSVFKNNLLVPLGESIWKFPFDICYKPNSRVYRSKLFIHEVDHLQYKYSAHPRAPYRSPVELFDHIYSTLKSHSQKFNKPYTYTIIDFFRDFRVWANYIDINNLINLRGPGYCGFLDQNLSTIMFLISAISELSFMAIFSPTYFVSELQLFYDLISSSNEHLSNVFEGTPIYQRYRIFVHLGFVDDSFRLIKLPDPNRLQLNNF